MKTNSLAKFSLTIIAAMVLAACGSSGGSDSPSTNSTASTTAAQAAAKKAADEAAAAKKAADEAAAKEAAAKKAADEAAAKKAADEAAAKKAADEAAAALAAENSDRKADNAVLRPTPTGSDLLEKSSVGAKNVVKNRSNLTTNYSSAKDSTSNTPELMNVQSPDKELKTLVVGQAVDKKDGKVKVTSLAGLENLSKAAPTDGKLTFEAAVKAKKDDKAKDDKAKDDKAKDDKAKDDKATVSVYTVQAGRKNYTENYGDDPKSKLKVLNAKGEDASAGNELRKPKSDNTSIVGQMYGAKITNVKEDGEETNAPFTQKPYKNVQYGSLTSALHAQDISTLGDGDEKDTKIAKYGYTGTEGTEDNYFYRLNENNMDVAGLKKLKNDNPNTVLKYDGHAVTYGIDNSWVGPAKPKANSVPTAIVAAETAAESGLSLISGTHVTAKINLNTNVVEGNLYNKWYDGALKGVKDVRLVDFTGSMSENGNIAGTSHNNINNTGGLFGASLNKEATEMGGVVSSNDHTAGGKWGAVFGAQLTGRETVPSAKPATPADPVKPADEPSINSSGNVTR